MVVVRFGTIGAVIVDISESGIRVEHYSRVQTGRRIRIRFRWEGQPIDIEGIVLSCHVTRFAPGDEGLTIFESRASFEEVGEESVNALKAMVSSFVARGLAEQVANARGIGPVLAKDMPVFRSGVVDALREKSGGSDDYLLPNVDIVAHKGYIRCRLLKTAWEQKWTKTPAQPKDGFTVLATEPSDQIEMLRVSYEKGDWPRRRFIRTLARLSVEGIISPIDDDEGESEPPAESKPVKH